MTDQPCSHPAVAVAGHAVPYCVSCADIAATASRAERSYCRGLIREEIAYQHRLAQQNPKRGLECGYAIQVLERVLEEMKG